MLDVFADRVPVFSRVCMWAHFFIIIIINIIIGEGGGDKEGKRK